MNANPLFTSVDIISFRLRKSERIIREAAAHRCNIEKCELVALSIRPDWSVDDGSRARGRIVMEIDKTTGHQVEVEVILVDVEDDYASCIRIERDGERFIDYCWNGCEIDEKTEGKIFGLVLAALSE